MSTFASATELHGIDLEASTVGAGVRRGVVRGVPTIFVLITVVALLGGVSPGSALGLAVLPALVAGPYFGTLIVLSHIEEKRHLAEVTPLGGPVDHDSAVPHAA